MGDRDRFPVECIDPGQVGLLSLTDKNVDVFPSSPFSSASPSLYLLNFSNPC